MAPNPLAFNVRSPWTAHASFDPGASMPVQSLKRPASIFKYFPGLQASGMSIVSPYMISFSTLAIRSSKIGTGVSMGVGSLIRATFEALVGGSGCIAASSFRAYWRKLLTSALIVCVMIFVSNISSARIW